MATRRARSKPKKPGPLEGVTPEERLKRYTTLFHFTNEENIDIKKLADQWNANELGIKGMLNQARNNPKLYNDLRELGFMDEEFPEWWYSPAQNESELPEQPGTTVKSTEQTELKVNDPEVLDPVPPIAPASREEGPRRLPVQVLNKTEQFRTAEYNELQGSTDGFTENEFDLLGSKGYVRSPDGEWVHLERYPDGRRMITPVNPNAELRRLREESQGSDVLDAVNKNMIEQLQLTTQSIIKKVALNPTVFWLYQYVKSVRDPIAGIPLFEGDMGDFLSFCARFTGEAYYGVVPTYLTNRPSMLTNLRNRARNPGGQQQGDQISYNELMQGRDRE